MCNFAAPNCGEWAERHNILLILDMHACPGGQSSGDICDYDESKPSLWRL